MIDTQRLRQKILDLAIRGKLVPQDPADEPASVLLEHIHQEKLQLVADGKLKKKDVADDSVIYRGEDSLHYEKVGNGEPICIEGELPFELPEGWSWARLKSTSYGISYGVSNSAEANGSHRLLRITDIQNNKVNWNTVPYTTVSQEKAPSYSVNDDDILFARTGASVGKTYLASGSPDNAVYASYLIRVRLLQVLPRYFVNFFGSATYWEQITNKSVGIGQPNVNGTALSQLLISIPPLFEQQRIVEALDHYLALVDDIERSQTELDELLAKTRSKVLDLAIRGKLVPQDPADEPASVLLERIHQEKLQMVTDGKLKKKDVAGDSVIYRGEDNSYYEKVGNTAIAIRMPFELPSTWAWCRLRAYCLPQFKRNPENEFGYIDIESIDNKCHRIRRPKNMQASKAPSRAQRMVFAESTIFSMVRPYLENIALVGKSYENCIASTGFYICTPVENAVASSLFYTLISPLIVTMVNASMKGDNSPSVRKEDMESLLIPIAPLPEQMRITNMLKIVMCLLEA